MSANDRCREAAEAIRMGARFDFPEVRDLLLAVLDEAADGIRFPEGIADLARKISGTFRAEHDHTFEPPPDWDTWLEFCECGAYRRKGDAA